MFSSVIEECFKYFICLQTNVAIIASRCFKNRSEVAGLQLLPCAACLALSSLSPPLPSLFSISPLQSKLVFNMEFSSATDGTQGGGMVRRGRRCCIRTRFAAWDERWWDALMRDGRGAKLISVFAGRHPDSLYSPDVRALALLFVFVFRCLSLSFL